MNFSTQFQQSFALLLLHLDTQWHHQTRAGQQVRRQLWSFYPPAALFSLKASAKRDTKRNMRTRRKGWIQILAASLVCQEVTDFTTGCRFHSSPLLRWRDLKGPAWDFFFFFFARAPLTVPHVSVRSHERSCREVRPAASRRINTHRVNSLQNMQHRLGAHKRSRLVESRTLTWAQRVNATTWSRLWVAF